VHSSRGGVGAQARDCRLLLGVSPNLSKIARTAPACSFTPSFGDAHFAFFHADDTSVGVGNAEADDEEPACSSQDDSEGAATTSAPQLWTITLRRPKVIATRRGMHEQTSDSQTRFGHICSGLPESRRKPTRAIATAGSAITN
jgi:hypothetical protein